MIVEHEILEQILDDDWTLSRTVAFLEDMEADAWQIIFRHAREQNIVLLEEKGDVIPDWRIQEIVRDREVNAKIIVHCTEKGGRLVT